MGREPREVRRLNMRSARACPLALLLLDISGLATAIFRMRMNDELLRVFIIFRIEVEDKIS